jgi:N-acetylglucosamine kinase-like BadF-type ATPase
VTRVLAVDGGQSTIRVRYSEAVGMVELTGVSHQEGDTIGSVATNVGDGWRALGGLPVDRAVLGLTTSPADEPSRRRLCERVADAVNAPEVWLADDAVTAHAGALSLGWGVSVTAGTGVACLAVPPVGRPAVVGGHGFLLGDEGGAFWIGREGLRAVLRAGDGRGARTSLEGPAAERFGGLDDLSARLHAVERPVDAIARFAPDVLAAAASGDAVSTTIVDQAVDELVVLVRAATSSIEHAPRVPVALGGRLLGDGPLRGRLADALAAAIPYTEVRGADGSPLEGALLLGDQPEPGRYAPLVHVWTASS